MKLTLTDNDGVVLDSMDVSRAEWVEAHENMMAAAFILRSLDAGKEAQ
jgi:beta-phosphoglucomutase-like phosphatase (HAD superfamily)